MAQLSRAHLKGTLSAGTLSRAARSRYTPAEIDARIAKLDSTLMALGDAALEFTRFLDQVYQQDDPSLALTPEVLAELANEEQDISQRFAFLFEQRGFLADYQILLTPTYHNEEQRKDAAGRMADRLEKAGPFAPNARLALKKAASIHNRDWKGAASRDDRRRGLAGRPAIRRAGDHSRWGAVGERPRWRRG